MERTHVRRIGLPRELRVRAAAGGEPVEVGRRRVEHVRDEWRVDEGWWSGSRIRRHYYDLVLDDGRNVIAFWDARRKRWYSQRG